MKKIHLACALFSAVFIFSGCSFSTTTNTNSNTSSTSTSSPWIGEWVMTSEVADIGAGSITNPATHKTIQFEDGGVFIEDYSTLEGLGACDDTKGKYTSTWTEENDVISVDVPGSVEEIEPYISCGTDAGTTAVPHSIAHFSYLGDSWMIEYDEAADSLTATITGPPGTITQVFERL